MESKYNVKVIKTNVINAKSKVRRLGNSVGEKPGYKNNCDIAERSKIGYTPQ